MPIHFENGDFIYTGPASVLSALSGSEDDVDALLRVITWLGNPSILNHECDGEPCPIEQLTKAFRPFFEYIIEDIPALTHFLYIQQRYTGVLYPMERQPPELPSLEDIMLHVNDILGMDPDHDD